MEQSTSPRIVTRTPAWLAILFLAALMAGALPAAAQTDVTGFWILSVPTGDGNFMSTYFDIKQSGEEITGTVWLRGRKLAISGGSYSGGKLHFAVALSAEHPDRKVL